MLEDLLTRKPYNAASDFIDAAIERGFGQKVAFIDTRKSLTYAALQGGTCQFANALRKVGVSQEERVALLIYDCIEFPIAFWGCLRAGAVALPLNTFLTIEQYAYILNDSRASTLIVSALLMELLHPILKKLSFLRAIIIINPVSLELGQFSKDCKIYNWNEFLSRGDETVFTAPTLSDEVAFWMYTSGTTGEPKAVKHVHTTLMSAAQLMGQETLGICENDVIFSAAKLFFSYGLGSAAVSPLLVGATTILLSAPVTAERVFEIFSIYQPTVFFGVPSLYAKMLTHEDKIKKIAFSQLRVAVSAGESLPKDLGMSWKSITKVDVLDGLGSTEMFHTFLSNKPDDICYGTMGKPVPGYELKIIDEEGMTIAEEEIGELLVMGPTSAEGYWNQRLKSKQIFMGEWTRTGDRCFKDAEGYYHYIGRVDDMFKVNGLWVSPSEIEAVMVSHEAVKEVAVIGKSDEDNLLKPKAFVVLQEGYILDEELRTKLILYVKKRIGPWKYPRWIETCESLPRTASGKIMRASLIS
jgi:4-hydroxybenzoate-CoA ligase